MAARFCGGDGGRLRAGAGVGHAAGGAAQTLDGVSVSCRSVCPAVMVSCGCEPCVSLQVSGVQQPSAGRQLLSQKLFRSGPAMSEHRPVPPGGPLQPGRLLELLPVPQQGKIPVSQGGGVGTIQTHHRIELYL